MAGGNWDAPMMERTGMRKILSLVPLRTVVLYGITDTLLVGMGMGVPILPILFGFPVGWYLGTHLVSDPRGFASALPRVLAWSALTSGLTFLEMLVIWGRTLPVIFGPASDVADFGHPFILYGPKASFIGWLVLMILVSPFLQFLMTVFGANLRNVLRNRPAPKLLT
jgi:hypothetical protein